MGTEETNFGRRLNDAVDPNSVTPAMLFEMLLKMHKDIMEIREDLNSNLKSIHKAFLKDEDNNPDFFGHRMDHKTRQMQAEKMSGYKEGVAKKVLEYFVVSVITLIAVSVFEYVRTVIGAR